MVVLEFAGPVTPVLNSYVTQGIRLAEENGLSLDAYRFETLDILNELAAPVRIREAV